MTPLATTPFVPAEDTTSTMRVKKRNGEFESVDVNKIVRAVMRCCAGLASVDPMKVATKTIGGLYDGATTKELDNLSIQTAALLIGEEPEYSRLASRLLSTYIIKEVENQDIHSFSQSIGAGHRAGLISDAVFKFVSANARKLNDAVEPTRTDLFEYFGLRTVYDRYLLKDPKTRDVIESPQYFFLRVACGLAQSVTEAVELYSLMSRFEHMPSSPTLFNSGTRHAQMSSCYLLDSPQDDLEEIYKRYTDIALLSKFSGGIGVAYHRVRARGSLIQSTNGHSNGIVPWLKTLDSSVVAVNQGGKRKGACCVYLEVWHADIEEFLELRDNTGDAQRRTHNLHLSNWIPDLFMRRVEEDGEWSLFDPKAVPQFTDLYGKAFEEAYLDAESRGLFMRRVKARALYARMMKTLAETGNGWINFKDACNAKSNQTGAPGNVIHSSNLCTEILEVTSQGETAVCNLGSINLAKYVEGGKFDFARLAENVKIAVKYLDRVIDINFYPTEAAAASNKRWRPVGLGVMGLQDAFFQLGLPFDAPEARALSAKIQEEIYFHALTASAGLAEKAGAHSSFPETRAAKGVLQFEHWGVTPEDPERWDALRKKIMKTGLRNSLLIAIAPTATIASIVGSYESIEPQTSNLFKRETLSGEFLQINRYLVNELKSRGLWTEAIRTKVKLAEGSIQGIEEIPEDIRAIYRTTWELPMRSLIDMAAARGAFIDQSQSLNLFMESPNIGRLSSMYMYAWKQGIKTTYYLRSRPATRIAKATVTEATAQTVVGSVQTVPEPVAEAPAPAKKDDAAAVSCSLENPDSCEACQ
ncbi:MAG TPA: ribonucleoside-diphosphate reductase subunit alpha [Elusimicrobiota bacterium]|nr:ribonucleoside-diphosphate reductase subunit alpha [Elusimicrobiota bacterium]